MLIPLKMVGKWKNLHNMGFLNFRFGSFVVIQSKIVVEIGKFYRIPGPICIPFWWILFFGYLLKIKIVELAFVLCA